MEIKGTTRVIAIFGDPVSHSLSPAMHNAGFSRYGLDYAYVPLRVPASGLQTALEAMRLFGFLGANVTLPHKQAVMPYLDEIREVSRRIGAVNTILNENGRLIGTTTDAEGFLEGFREKGHSFAGRSVAILGNGGSARTAACALLMEDRPARIVIAGRDPDKARRLASEINAGFGLGAAKSAPTPLEAVSLADYPAIRKGIQVVVNTTPMGMRPNTDSSPLRAEDLEPGQIVYDIVYTPERTRLIRDAESRGLTAVGGLGMLVHQGLSAFALWTGIRPEAGLFYEAARAELARSGRPQGGAGPDGRGKP